MISSLALFGWLAASQPAVFFSHIISAPATGHQFFSHIISAPATGHQPAVFFSHNKSAPTTSHQPAERGQELSTMASFNKLIYGSSFPQMAIPLPNIGFLFLFFSTAVLAVI
jgi:hypothetical protein